MTKHYFKAILISLLAVAAWSQTAVAETTPSRYGSCGDGVVEVNPYAGSSVTGSNWNAGKWNSLWKEAITGYAAPGAYFYRGSTADGFSPQTPWPTAAGEMCDDGPNSPVFCKKDSCTIFNYVIPGSVDKTKFLNDSISECYSSNKCAPGIGNGIIQPGTRNIPDPSSPSSSITIEFNEECDDGNITAGDGCSPLGKIELAEKYVSGVCGNGIVDGDDVCDDGNIRDGDGCSSDCKSIGLSQVCKGTVPQRGTGDDQKLCGNGRVDYALGEQCDEGKDKNGMPDSSCRVNCVLRSSPQFSLNKIAFWKSDIPNIKMDVSDEAKADKTVNDAWPIPADGNDTSKYKVENKNQKVAISYAKDQQLSGVFLTDQSISELKEGSKIFKDGKIHLKMVFSPTEDGSVHIWDDDAFGIVFGIKEGDQSKYEALGDSYKYLMLSWRSYQPASWTRAYVRPGCNDERQSHYGPTGLRLYQITGVPNYIQLWTMRGQGQDCSYNSNNAEISNAKIEEIATNNIDDWEFVYDTNDPKKKLYPKKPGDGSWNRVINPFLPLNTFYAVNFGYGQSAGKQRLQIDVEFSKEELKVWVNRVLAIHIIRKNSPIADSWPTEGQLGFYFLGMDNLTVDTSGYYSYVEDTSTVDSASDSQSTTCSNYCGNGIIENDDPSVYSEECDDGNTVDGDGCSSTCTLEKNSDLCRDYNGEVLCFGGAITGPKDGQSVKTKNPTISGTYVGDPADIKVTITNGTASCEGSVKSGEVKKNADGTWAFNKDCNLADGGHEVTVDFVPTQSTQGTNFPIIKETSTFTVDSENGDAISLQVDQPAGDPVFVSRLSDKFPVSGTVDNATNVHVKICEVANPNICVERDFEPATSSSVRKNWSGTIDTSSLNAGDAYTITFEATDGAKDPQTVTKDLKVIDATLEAPKITNIKEGEQPRVIPNPDGTITVEGTEEIPGKCQVNEGGTAAGDTDFDPAKCPPIYVTLQTNRCVGKGKKAVVPVKADGTYRADVPVCVEANESVNGIPVTITAKATDSTGNESDPTTRVVKIVEKSEPKILITCPKSTSTAGDCLLLNGKSGGMGLVVNGESNIRSERPVTVTAYPKKGDKCDFDPAALGEPVGTITTTTTPEGKWAVDFKHVKSGDYCIVAKLTTKDGKNPVNTTTANGYQRGQLDEPEFVDNATKITQKLYDAGNNPVDITVEADQNSNIIEGDTCKVTVQGTSTSETSSYIKDGDVYKCTVQFPNPKDIIGKTLVATSEPVTTDDGAQASEEEPMKLPTAKIVKVTGEEKVNVEIGEDFPGAVEDAEVIFNVSGSTSSFPENKCKLTKVGTVFKCKEAPVLKNDLGVITEIDANTTVTASLGGKELQGTVMIDGNPTITITCPNSSTASGTGTGCQLEDGSAGEGYVVKGNTSISAPRSVEVKVYKKENGTCNKAKTVLTPETITTGTDGVWYYDPNLKGLPSGEYCVVATLIGNNNKTATQETTITYTRPSIDSNRIEFADDSQPTDIAEASIRKDSTVPVTLKPAAGDTNIIKGDKCVITVKDGNSVIDGWGKEGVFDKDNAGDLICTVYLKTEKGSDTLLGKTLVATAVDQGDPNNVSDPVDETIPGLPVLTPEADGKVKIVVDAKYPGAGKGIEVTFRDENNDTVGKCNLEEIPIGKPNAGDFECTSENALTDNGEADGTKLIDEIGSTEVGPFIGNGKVPDVKVTIDGKKIGITCAEGSGCTGKTNGLDVTGVVAETPQNGESVKVTVYEKGDNGECSASQHGTKVIATKTDVTVDDSDKTWAASFNGLQSGEYCVVAELLDSNNNPIESAAEVATFNRTANIDSNDTVAFVDPAQQPAEIAKAVVDGEATVPVKVKPGQDANIIAGDKCIVYVEGEADWEGQGTFEKVGDKLTCTADLDTKNNTSGESLLGKKLIAKAVQKGDNTKTTGPSGPLAIPGKPTMVANPDGTVTITIPDGYPSPGDGEFIVIKEGEDAVGRCEIRNGDAGNLICKTESPLEKDGVLLKDNVASSTEVTATFTDGSKETTVTANIPGVAQESTPTIADGAAAIVDKIKAANGGAISVDVKPSENSNIKEGDKCEVYVKGDSNWKAEGTFQTVNGELLCTAEGLKTVNGDKELYGKTLVAKAIAKNNPNNVSTPSQPVTVPDKEVTNPDDPGQGGDKQDGTYTEKGDAVIVKIPPKARGLEVGNKLQIKNSRGDIVGDCVITEDWTCPVTKDDDAGVVTKDLTGTLLGPNGELTTTTIPLTPEAVGFVAGGCSTTDSPESGLLALLFAALGFFGIRRRRD